MEIRITFNESESETLQEIIEAHKQYKPYNIDKLLFNSLREYMNTNFIPPSIELVGEGLMTFEEYLDEQIKETHRLKTNHSDNKKMYAAFDELLTCHKQAKSIYKNWKEKKNEI